MMIYVLNIISIVIWREFFIRVYETKRAEQYTLLVVTIQMILISGLRGMEVGTDTKTYNEIFLIAGDKSFSSLFHYYIESGYMIWNWLVYHLFGSYQILMILNAIIIMYGLYRYIIEESEDVLFSLLLFICIGYFSSSMNICRQYIALIFVLCAYHMYLTEKNKFKVFVLFCGASMFHSSAIMIVGVIVSYELIYHTKFKQGNIVKLIALIFVVVFFILLEKVLPILVKYMASEYSYERAVEAAGYKTSFFSVSLMIKIFSSLLYYYIVKKKIIRSYEKERLQFYNYLNLLSCIISVAAGYVSLISRMNLYFSIISIIFLPNLMKYIKMNKALKILMYLMFFLLYIVTLRGKDTVPWTFLCK